MSAGRRGLILSTAFALLALGLYQSPRARAQPESPFGRHGGFHEPHTGRHTIWRPQLAGDQLRKLFSEYEQGDSSATKQLEDLLRGAVKQKNPNVDDARLDAAIKKLLADKEFMNRVTDLAQKHKNAPGRDPNTMVVPEDVEKDFARLRERMAQSGQPDPFKVPKADPDRLPKFDPKSFDPQNFDPDEFPHADPKNPPQIDPRSGLPVDPRTARPFDPRTGRPIDPRTGESPPPKAATKNGDPRPQTKIEQINPPKVDARPRTDPNTGRPVEPKEPTPEPVFDPERPQAPQDTPEQLAKQKAFEAAAALWEKNVGPIDESPAVKRAIYDLIADREAMDALTDSKGNSLFDLFKDGADGEGLKDLFGGMDGKWEWPKLDWKLDWGRNSGIDFPDGPSRSRWPDTSGSRWPSWGKGDWGGGMGSFNFGGAQVPWLLFLLVLALIVAAVVWWKWDALRQLATARRGARVADGLGPWPVDPHEIASREDVVKAFEYLSVLICGPGAKTWTHSTVAEELTALARTQPEVALKLARLYELARYAPLDEPLTRPELLEARRLVCDLAGLS